ncbi:alpha/beta fold hydrolase [Croceitalea sp. MTPC9]|uniref:alpha/beta fold hydrolase n=1 Tax=unclassified Croceitalea TaxID=2632280 RepID=UPI002B38778F|nr:alpha/beta fold hydrolase [Croceitalea sp. MTPC6]GMN15559.1 alpha/beta fold hydrolase [Croceitalea sp. MTPC9]
MKNLLIILVSSILLFSCNTESSKKTTKEKSNPNTEVLTETNNDSIPYGNNSGQKVNVNGIEMYYEIYGQGEPLVIIHGNGGDISKMAGQIDFLKDKYKVIIADSRGHGKSQLNTDKLTLALMADDWKSLLDKLKIENANFYGFSDGGNIAMIIASKYPNKVKKLAVMGSNMRPDTSAIYPWAEKFVDDNHMMVKGMIAKKDDSAPWAVIDQHLDLLDYEPKFTKEMLGKIEVPVLVMAADKDIIKEEHSVEFYQSFPNSQLVIFPGETHFVPLTNPDLFNPFLDRFFGQEFNRPDSKDVLLGNQ